MEAAAAAFDYDPETDRWTVGFTAAAGDHYTVVVSDGSGDAWSGSGKG